MSKSDHNETNLPQSYRIINTVNIIIIFDQFYNITQFNEITTCFHCYKPKGLTPFFSFDSFFVIFIVFTLSDKILPSRSIITSTQLRHASCIRFVHLFAPALKPNKKTVFFLQRSFQIKCVITNFLRTFFFYPGQNSQ